MEAQQNLQEGKFETCATLCRKTIELATKNLRGDVAKQETLYVRIGALKDGHFITPAMADWAYAVRIDGNDSIHDDDEITGGEAAELLQFCEAFLMYAYTMQAMVGRRNVAD